METAKRRGFAEICLIAGWSIWVPMQNRPVNKQILLISFNNELIGSEGDRIELSVTAKAKKRTKMGTPRVDFFSLKYQAENNTKGTIHKVRPSFKVAATSTAWSPITDAAPITEAVS